MDLDNVNPAPVGASQADPAPDSDAPLLTVKRESDTTQSTNAAGEAAASPGGVTDPKRPERAAEPAGLTPRPLERATTGVLIRDSRPAQQLEEESSLGPTPDPSAISIQPFDPTAAAPAEAAPPAEDDMITSLSIQQADLGMPNPAYEQNTTILAEFQNAVRMARAEDHAGAARAFREYVINHPSSGLAPRAAFLSIIFEKSRSQARADLESLKQQFPKSRYVAEAEKRRGDELAIGAPATSAPSAGAQPSASGSTLLETETPQQQIARLERELTAAVGDPAREPLLRKNLGVLYLQQEEAERAYEVLRPAADMASDQPLNGEILVALGRTLMARGETVQAISLYEAVEAKHPGLIESSAANTWSVALAYEGAGKYGRARTLYNLLRQNYPGTAEAGWASARLNDLAALQR
jgi:TolA-binding protein